MHIAANYCVHTTGYTCKLVIMATICCILLNQIKETILCEHKCTEC